MYIYEQATLIKSARQAVKDAEEKKRLDEVQSECLKLESEFEQEFQEYLLPLAEIGVTYKAKFLDGRYSHNGTIIEFYSNGKTAQMDFSSAKKYRFDNQSVFGDWDKENFIIFIAENFPLNDDQPNSIELPTETNVCEFEQTYDFLQKQFDRLSMALSERRSDISEMIMHILDGNEFDESYLEGRYVYASIPNGGQIFYDTLTTIIDYSASGDGNDWVALNTTYSDDTFDCTICNQKNIERVKMADGYQVCLVCKNQN